ncbi:MAG: hypothetical protein WH035_07105, partial [Spirochaetota bacterium]
LNYKRIVKDFKEIKVIDGEEDVENVFLKIVSYLNEKKIRVNILLSDYINDFKQINIYKFQDNKKILLESKSINDIIKNANILEFYYSYSNEKKNRLYFGFKWRKRRNIFVFNCSDRRT